MKTINYSDKNNLNNNPVKFESCSVIDEDDNDHQTGLDPEPEDLRTCGTGCRYKYETSYKCDLVKCEHCYMDVQLASSETDKDSGILIDDKLNLDSEVKEELTDKGVAESDEFWKKPDYEETVPEDFADESLIISESENNSESLRCKKLAKSKLSLGSLSNTIKTKNIISERTLSVGSARELIDNATQEVIAPKDTSSPKKKTLATKKADAQKRKSDPSNMSIEPPLKKAKVNTQSLQPTKIIAPECHILEAIDQVIADSRLFSEKKYKKPKTQPITKVEKVKQNRNIIAIIKKAASKKLDIVKTVFTDKLVQTKSEQTDSVNNNVRPKITKNSKHKIKNKRTLTNTETKTKAQEVPNNANKDLKEFKEPKKQKESTKLVKNFKIIKPKDPIKKVEPISEKYETEKSVVPQHLEVLTKPQITKGRRKGTKKLNKKEINKKEIIKIQEILEDTGNSLTLSKKGLLKPKWSNGWHWEGESFKAKVFLTTDLSATRKCFASMRHDSGYSIRPRDCVLLKSDPRKADLPFVAKIAALWENPDDGEMMFSLLWYYRPEHTEQGKGEHDRDDEVFASRHQDANSVACIEEKCYILTFNEYCRYRKNLRRFEEGLDYRGLIVPPGEQIYPRETRQPPIPVPQDIVLFCRRVYGYRGKKLIKNPR